MKIQKYLKNKWYDDQCKFAIEEMKKAKRKVVDKRNKGEGRAGVSP